MRLIVQPDYTGIAEWTANYIATQITKAAPSAESPFVIGLPSGKTSVGVYQHLVKLYEAGEIDFTHVVTFCLDEFAELHQDHPQSQHTYMWSNLFGKVNIQRENVNILDGNAADLEAECALFEEKLAALGGLDLVFFSTGPDGHVARNEPGSSLKSITRPKTLALDTHEALSTRWGVPKGQIPKVCLTMGIGTMRAAKDVLVMFNGSSRARALEAALEKGVNHMFPVTAFQKHRSVVFVCDEDATLELRVKTVHYFKGLQKTAEAIEEVDFGYDASKSKARASSISEQPAAKRQKSA
mmetsp:Transcript_15148/g.31766  ORF Transcript_15148/g.31766 Transcript_15148/m.31766 type:complete len:297 (-) Transcript_15148:88-978(-)